MYVFRNDYVELHSYHGAPSIFDMTCSFSLSNHRLPVDLPLGMGSDEIPPIHVGISTDGLNVWVHFRLCCQDFMVKSAVTYRRYCRVLYILVP